MTFDKLADFLNNRMRMSHVYQPVMLLTLLAHGGRCSTAEIAKSILLHDQSQIEYYEKITKEMPGQVLGKHGIVKRDGSEYHLVGFDQLTPQEVSELIRLCNAKLQEYVAQRGELIWQHRRKSSGYIPGTLRYEILKQAKFRCELCGIPAEEKALEIDHITPRNQGGADDLTNLQALCYSCNAMKRDRDNTDFSKVIASYQHREKDCLFCEMPEVRVIAQNALAYAVYDGYPVTELHTLVVPRRHVATYFELGRPEINACNMLLNDLKGMIQHRDANVSGYNIGMNNGETAGQTIFHCHIHLIPRRPGDVENPRGGVRHVIPGKGTY